MRPVPAPHRGFVWLCGGVHLVATAVGVLAALQLWTWVDLPWLPPAAWRPAVGVLHGQALAGFLLAALPFAFHLLILSRMACHTVTACLLALSMALNASIVVFAGPGPAALLCGAVLVAGLCLAHRHAKRAATLKYLELSSGGVEFGVLALALAGLLVLPTRRPVGSTLASASQEPGQRAGELMLAWWRAWWPHAPSTWSEWVSSIAGWQALAWAAAALCVLVLARRGAHPVARLDAGLALQRATVATGAALALLAVAL